MKNERQRQPVPGVYGPPRVPAITQEAIDTHVAAMVALPPPEPGDVVVLMVSEAGLWEEDTTATAALLSGGPLEWLVDTTNGDSFWISRGPDGRWWSYGALREYVDRPAREELERQQ